MIDGDRNRGTASEGTSDDPPGRPRGGVDRNHRAPGASNADANGRDVHSDGPESPNDGGHGRDGSSAGDSPNRLHPLTMPYRIVQGGMRIVPLVFVLGIVALPMLGPIGPVLAAVLAIGGILAIIGWHVAYYRRFSYLTTVDTFDIRSGVISRRHREIPYRRIQNVDITRNLVQRALGIAQLDIETAGGSQTEASLRYVGYDEAKRLQDELYRRKRREDSTSGREAGGEAVESGADERVLYSISSNDLLVLAIASIDLRILSFLGILLSIVSPPFLVQLVTDLSINPILVVGGIVIGLAIVSAVVSGTNAVINTFGFVLSQRGDELRYERGLIQRYDGSIPLDKVQTLAFRENVLKRRFGYSTLAIETAGYAPGRGEARIGSESAVPIARRELTWAIGRAVEPFGEITLERPPKRARIRYAFRYLMAVLVLSAVVAAGAWYFDVRMYWPIVIAGVALSPLAAHYKWKSRGYYLGTDYLVTRTGFWRRITRVVPAYRVQTVIESQSVFQRRWGLASVTIDTAGTSSLIGGDATAYDLDQADARDASEAAVERLRAALRSRVADRRSIGPERMPTEGIPSDRSRSGADDPIDDRSRSAIGGRDRTDPGNHDDGSPTSRDTGSDGDDRTESNGTDR